MSTPKHNIPADNQVSSSPSLSFTVWLSLCLQPRYFSVV